MRSLRSDIYILTKWNLKSSIYYKWSGDSEIYILTKWNLKLLLNKRFLQLLLHLYFNKMEFKAFLYH